MLAVMVLTVVVATGSLLYLRALDGRILYGVRAVGVDVGGLTPLQAQQSLDSRVSSYLAAPAVVRFEGREWRPTAADIGLRVDLDATIQQAFARGRQGSLLQRAQGLGAVLGLRADVPPAFTLDEEKWTAYLRAIGQEINHPAQDARLEVKGGQLVLSPAQDGRQLDVQGTARLLADPAGELRTQEVALQVVPLLPALREAELVPLQERAESLLSAAPLTLTYGGRSWPLSRADLLRLIAFERRGDAGQGALYLAADEKGAAAFFAPIARQINRDAVEPVFRWSGAAAVLAKAGQDGLRLDTTAAAQLVIEQAAPERRTLELPVLVTKPRVTATSAEELGITALVARGRSTYVGSAPERAWNIQLAATRIGGALVAPGETFSFLKRLGPISKENGYREGLVIKNGETVKDDGGGVCQVSTTLFRAVFWSGLPIVERHQHTYRVSYYEQDGSPPGFDAAVYDPGVDFKFLNDTGGWLLIEASIDTRSSALSFSIYGTKPDWTVQLAAAQGNRVPHGPPLPEGTDPTMKVGTRRQVEWAVDGLDATITRTVRTGETSRTDRFFSRYTPWREKWIVGTKPDPAAAQPTQAPASQPTAQPSPQAATQPAAAQPSPQPAAAQPTAQAPQASPQPSPQPAATATTAR
jgi:vancomycin resistance protein YoaR